MDATSEEATFRLKRQGEHERIEWMAIGYFFGRQDEESGFGFIAPDDFLTLVRKEIGDSPDMLVHMFAGQLNRLYAEWKSSE